MQCLCIMISRCISLLSLSLAFHWLGFHYSRSLVVEWRVAFFGEGAKAISMAGPEPCATKGFQRLGRLFAKRSAALSGAMSRPRRRLLLLVNTASEGGHKLPRHGHAAPNTLLPLSFSWLGEGCSYANFSCAPASGHSPHGCHQIDNAFHAGFIITR